MDHQPSRYPPLNLVELGRLPKEPDQRGRYVVRRLQQFGEQEDLAFDLLGQQVRYRRPSSGISEWCEDPIVTDDQIAVAWAAAMKELQAEVAECWFIHLLTKDGKHCEATEGPYCWEEVEEFLGQCDDRDIKAVPVRLIVRVPSAEKP